MPIEQRSGLRWLRAATVLGGAVPLALFLAAAGGLYQQAFVQANQRVERIARIGEEHALKVLETDIALMNRAFDLLGDESDDALIAREALLHQQLVRMATGLPQLQGLFVIGASGRMIANNRAFPALHTVDFSDRPAFVHHRQGGAQPFLSEVLTSRTTGEAFFDLSLQRSLRDGSFGGTVSTSMTPDYFAAFYREISDDIAGLSIELRRADGVLLAGWPQSPNAADRAGASTTAGSAATATRDARGSGVAADGGDPTATRRLGAYPVVVTASMTRSAVLAPWYGQIVLMLAVMFPAASGLMYVGWIALQRTRHALATAEALRTETRHRAKAEEALRQSQKMEAVGQLTGGIAHDFNNLLQVISANLHLIGRDPAMHGPLKARLAQAHEAVKRGAKLANQLLAFGRRQPLEPQVVNVGKLVLGLEDMLRRTLGEAIELEAIVSGGLWNAFIDPSQIENAILNLAINARDAMPDSGKLTIEVSNASLDEAYASQQGDIAPGQYVMLAVSDTGVGMTAETAAQAFEPFFTTKPVGAGTGLGLSMVYGFVKQSGGHVRIYTEVGHGTTIKLYLPRSHRGEEAQALAAPNPGSGGRETILVVEDDEAVRQTTVDMLAALGYRLLTATDADSALAIVNSGVHVDLLFTDVVMPGLLRSPELARRARERLPDIAVLYTSGYTQNAIVHGGRLDPGVELLVKPYTAEALATRVRAVLGKQATQLAAARRRSHAVDALPPSADETMSRTVLLVEDDEIIRATTAELLRSLGHRVIDARSAEEAIELLVKADVDVLIVDIGLPGMSGDVFAAQVRSVRPTIGIVFASGKAQVRADASDDSGPVLLRKPYDGSEIAEALRQALARRTS